MTVTVGDYVRFAAATTPDRPALVDTRTGRTATYRELDERTERMAHALLSQLGPGDRIGCWLTTSIAYVEVYLAAAKAGLVIVPINERYTAFEAAHIVTDAGVRALIFASERADEVDELPLHPDTWRINVGAPIVGALPIEELGRAAPNGTVSAVSPSAPFGVVYTSGTTGRPKGAVLTHASVTATNRSNALAYRLVPRGTAIYGASMSFTGTVLGHILTHLFTGSTVVITGTSEPGAILDACQNYEASFVGMPPPLIPEFTDALRRATGGLPHLRTLLQTGGRVPIDVVTELNELLSGRLVLGWGMTEISGGAAAVTTEHDMRRALEGRATSVLRSVGRPVPGCAVRTTITPGEDDDADPDVAELVLRSESVMAGYWGLPEETARVMADGWYHTGDLGRIDEEGYVHIVDRRTDLIVSGGANVYPTEVEETILAMPAVAAVAAVGTPHQRWGQTVTAVVVVRSGAHLTAEDVLSYCRGKLASYKKPTRVLFTDDLPRTISGKVQRNRVRAWAESAYPPEPAHQKAGLPGSPTDSTERP